MPSDRQRERVVRQLIAQVTCPRCQERYELDDVAVIGHEAERWLLRLSCRSCQRTSLMAAVVRKATPPPSPPRTQPVGAGDVRAMREFLKDFDGNFVALFNRA